ncbi:MAG: NADH-ubiquinone oxidoreductase subunit NDUFA12 family protein [Alphaproteobacteria bacterium]
MNIGTLIYTWLTCKKVGIDQFGNCYYISKEKNTDGKFRRSVIYKGITEASKIPPMWHAWLHYTSDDLPSETKSYPWQKEHIPNLTGTNKAYLPSGHVSQGQKQKKFTDGNYKPWQP